MSRVQGYALALSQWAFALATVPSALACASSVRAAQLLAGGVDVTHPVEHDR